MENVRNPVWFDVILYPHRSLSRRGFVILMTVLCLISFTAGMVFVSIGAWPVFGFFGLDVLAIWWAFRASYRSARITETLTLTDDALLVSRRDGDGPAREWRFEPSWVKVLLEEPRPAENRLCVRSHGNEVVIGSFLNHEERTRLAEALKQALHRRRAGLFPATG